MRAPLSFKLLTRASPSGQHAILTFRICSACIHENLQAALPSLSSMPEDLGYGSQACLCWIDTGEGMRPCVSCAPAMMPLWGGRDM